MTYSKHTSSLLKHVRNVLPYIAGNALEWYDFAVYAYFSTIIGRVVFAPHNDAMSALIKTYGMFFAGFLMRPLGGMIFGYIGDHYGREKSLAWSTYLMAIPTTCIGLLPSYTRVGAWSAFGLFVLRLLQGLSIGGAFTGTMILMVEKSPDGTKVWGGSWASFSALLGLIMGSVMGTCMTFALSSHHLNGWGWRVPFVISIAGSWIASSIKKTKTSAPPSPVARPSILNTMRHLRAHHQNAIWRLLWADCVVAVGFFTIYTYTTAYLHSVLGYTHHFCTMLSTTGLVCAACMIPVAGRWGDTYGTATVLRWASCTLAIVAIPFFMAYACMVHSITVIGHLILCMLMACIFAMVPAFLVSLFPPAIRHSGISTVHNLCMALLGGSAPVLISTLVAHTHHVAIPGIVLALASVVSFLSFCSKPIVAHDRNAHY